MRDRYDYHGKNTLDRKSLRRKKNSAEDTNRMEWKNDYDGTGLPCFSDTDKVNEANSLDRTKVKSEHLDRNSRPRESYVPMDALFFFNRIGLLYLIETECVMGKLNPLKRQRKRRSRSVTKLLSAMYCKARAMLKDGQAHYREYMRKALNYMVNGWDDLQKYQMDGRYTIDNMLVERAVRPFVVKRNSTMFFSSEQGVMDAMTLYTIVETVKMYTTDVNGYIERALR